MAARGRYVVLDPEPGDGVHHRRKIGVVGDDHVQPIARVILFQHAQHGSGHHLDRLAVGRDQHDHLRQICAQQRLG